MRNQMNSGVLEEPEKISMLQRLLHYRNGSSNELMSDQDVISEGMGHTLVIQSCVSTRRTILFTASLALTRHPLRWPICSGSLVVALTLNKKFKLNSTKRCQTDAPCRISMFCTSCRILRPLSKKVISYSSYILYFS